MIKFINELSVEETTRSNIHKALKEFLLHDYTKED
jgi:hypothetical protein